ncbi:MAG: tetratricopeptide repeat protein [Myxococcales bacterium]|nr:tetratricopeptide repeat protein [Myxococcales bacterium]
MAARRGDSGPVRAQATEETAPGAAYSIRDVSKLFDMPESRLRYWSQTGFIQPSIRVKGRTWYSFRDLIALKVARELLNAGLSLQRVRRSLDALKIKLPDVDQPLARLRIRCEHDRVIVEDSERTYEAGTGQGMLDFRVQSLHQQAAQVVAMPRADEAEADRSAYEWFTLALEHERGWDGADPDDANFLDARQAYDRALDLDPEFAAAYTNLGALLAAVGDLDGARDHFDQALRCDPDQAEAQSNLAALALRLGDHDTAIAGYRQLLRSVPDNLEAHYGLARALLAVGGKGQALAHLERFCHGVDGLAPAHKDSSLKERRQHATRVILSLKRELGTG